MKRSFLLFLLFALAFSPIANAQSEKKVPTADQSTMKTEGMMESGMMDGSQGMMMSPQEMKQMMEMMRTMMEQQKMMLQGMSAQQKAESSKKLDGMMQQMNVMMKKMDAISVGMNGKAGAQTTHHPNTGSTPTHDTAEPAHGEHAQRKKP